MRFRKGITLVELILTLALVALVIPVVFSVFFTGSTSHSVSTNKGFAQQDIRIAADFLTDELRFITDISDVDYESGEYYSLRINNEGNLVKTKHVYQNDDSVVLTVIRSIPGNWDLINITNSESGRIDVKFEQIEKTGFKDAGFELEMIITTENSPYMTSNVDLDLVDGDILYYQNTTTSSLAHSIYLNKLDEAGGEQVTVTFYRNDGVVFVHDTIMGESGTTKNLPSIPLRGGYVFKEWNASVDGTGTAYGAGGITTFNMPTVDTDLYAIWEVSGALQKVTIDTTAGIDGIVSIDGSTPKIDGSNRFEVRKANDNPSGSDVKIKLLGYTSSHAGKVTVTIGNSPTAVEEGDYVTFRAIAGSNGGNNTFSVTIKIETNGHEQAFTKVYNFITK